MTDDTGLDAWRDRPAQQQPDWPDPAALRAVVEELHTLPPLVFPGECDRLRGQLAAAARGEAFVLQGGDCAETFAEHSADGVRNRVKTLLQMAAVLAYAAGVPVVKIGRMAGQYGKPRSSPIEVHDGVSLPAYRGDAVNDFAFTPAARTPEPRRLIRAYHHSAATVHLCHEYTRRGFADLRQVHTWNADFVADSPAGKRYERLASDIDRALAFVAACGAQPPEFRIADIYTSHEALILEYERALTRVDTRTGEPYGTSGHLLWIGERTRDLDGAHVALLSQVRNPVAVKLGPSATAAQVVALVGRLNPEHDPGRLTLITRMGAGQVRQVLPALVTAVATTGTPVVWMCDPMHGNTVHSADGRHKTRRFDEILAEVVGFFEVHRELGSHPGGIHIEFTAADVTECVGGGEAIRESDLGQRYETTCDPRLNRSQSVDLAFLLAELLAGDAGAAQPLGSWAA